MKISVKGLGGTYEVCIEENLLKRLPLKPDRPTFLLSDDGIPTQYIETAKDTLKPKLTRVVPAGEKAKSLKVYEALVHEMEKAELGRDCRIVALGGGVINDLGGFLAATYKRGVELILIPTTLLSMADACIGGKFALNTKISKNGIGTFYTPQHVFIDPETLRTLPKEHLANGMAEIVKIALVRDGDFYRKLCEGVSVHDDAVIARAVDLKRELVEQDPCDVNERALLNFGHTFGHAIESVTDYEYLHGFCVAAGMKIMARSKPYERSLQKVLQLYGVDEEISIPTETLLKQVRFDKKRRDDSIDLVVVETPGKGYIKRFIMNDLEAFFKERRSS